MKYWEIDDLDDALDKSYMNYMMLNATIPTSDDKGKGSDNSGGTMSFFDFGKQLAGIN